MRIHSENPKRLLFILSAACLSLFILYSIQASDLKALQSKNQIRKERLSEAQLFANQLRPFQNKNISKKENQFENLQSLLNSCASKSKVSKQMSSMIPSYDKKKKETKVKITIKNITFQRLLNFLGTVRETHSGVNEERVEVKSALLNSDRWNVSLQFSALDSSF